MGEWFVRNINPVQNVCGLNAYTNILDVLLTEKATYGNKKGIMYLVDEKKCNA